MTQSSTLKKDQNAAVSEVADDSEDEISLIDLIAVLWKNKLVVIICTFLAAVCGIVYALIAPEVFSTNTLFVTKTGRSGGAGNLSFLASLAGISMPSSSGSIDPSEYLDKGIQDQAFLAKLFEKKWAFKGDSLYLDSILEIQPDTTLPNWEYHYYMSKLEAIRKGGLISINKDPQTGILELTVNVSDPQLAYDINIYALNLISSYIRNSFQTQAKEKRTFIEDRLTETKVDLTKSEDDLVRFKERNLMSHSPNVMLEEARLTRQVTLNQEIFLELKKQYELVRLEELDDQTLVQVIKNPEVPIQRSKPKRSMLVIIATFAGFFIGVFVAFLLNALPSVITALSEKNKS